MTTIGGGAGRPSNSADSIITTQYHNNIRDRHCLLRSAILMKHPFGVVHANMGQKQLNCNILSIFFVRLRIFDATFMRCDQFQKSIAQTFQAILATPTKYHIVFPNSFQLV
jgi:hypothetical protein